MREKRRRVICEVRLWNRLEIMKHMNIQGRDRLRQRERLCSLEIERWEERIAILNKLLNWSHFFNITDNKLACLLKPSFLPADCHFTNWSAGFRQIVILRSALFLKK